MKNIFRVLQVNKEDSKLKAGVKRGVKLIIGTGLTVGAGLGVLKIVGKHINRNDEIIVFEDEMRAE